MFGGGSLWSGAGSSTESLAEKERNPPARPIPLEFPCYTPPICGSPLSENHIKTLCKHLATIKRPFDIQDSDLAQLNVHVEEEVGLEQFVPEDLFRSRPFLYDSDLDPMLSELDTANEDAYREILRLPPLEGKTKPRLAYSRNFFIHLEDMSRYWDDSKDQYYEVEAKDAENQDSSSAEEIRVKVEQQITTTTSGGIVNALETAEAGSTPQQPGMSTVEPSLHLSPPPEVMDIPTRPKLKHVYKGQRLGNGEQMSSGTRVSMVRSLLKMIVHKFNCRDFEISGKERLRIWTTNVPSVFYNFCVAKVPSEMKLARARIVEGPILAVHARSEVRFKSREGLLNPASDFLGEKYDFFRELGCMLSLAKQRGREGKEVPKGARPDQWWACKPRWGGGETRWGQLANEVFEEDDPSWSPEEARLQKEKREAAAEQERQMEAATAADLKNLKPEDIMSQALLANERPKKKKRSDPNGGKSADNVEYKDGRRLMYTQPLRRKWFQEWTKIRPNASTWDEKVIYRRIGKPNQQHGSDGWDNIYMLSSVNHHVCLLELLIHQDYVEWLETGKAMDKGDPPVMETTEQPQRHMLYMKRSRWYDVFDVDQRKELFTGIWRVMSWVIREEVPKEELEKVEGLKHQRMAEGADHAMEI
ncbi:hypothetical protein PV10_05544 [Exophiala mesophila]|uniref:Uncharacterized protein n=1 Tax=Exophiala mesophila TaxID=212818 RepID=A0A0D1ZAF3_EXOME|nr:uncharacterized protein PV10_05544 [Exophiala mesophila]KIV90944.1 hypothetical protein PV10_05544 [Exophiala mesophila]